MVFVHVHYQYSRNTFTKYFTYACVSLSSYFTYICKHIAVDCSLPSTNECVLCSHLRHLDCSGSLQLVLFLASGLQHYCSFSPLPPCELCSLVCFSFQLPLQHMNRFLYQLYYLCLICYYNDLFKISRGSLSLMVEHLHVLVKAIIREQCAVRNWLLPIHMTCAVY